MNITAVDTAGGNHGTFLNGAGRSSDVPEALTRAGLSFDGSDDVVLISDTSTADDGSFRWSAWVRVDAIPAGDRAFLNENSSGSNSRVQLGVKVTTGNPYFFIRNDASSSATAQGSTSIADGKWHFWEASCTGSGGTMDLRIDGVSVDTDTHPGGTFTLDESRIGEQIGAANFAGVISDVKMYSDAAGSTLVHHWPLDEGSGTDAADVVGANDGTLSGGPTWHNPSDKGDLLAQSMSFDGTDDVVDCGDAGTDEVNSAVFTLSAWVKHAASVPGTNELFLGFDSVVDSSLFYLYLSNSDGSARAWGRNSVSTAIPVLTGAVVTDDEWHHIAVTMDGSGGTGRLYVDGVLGDSDTHPGGTWTNTVTTIGDGPSGKEYEGKVDDVRIYNVALDPADILALARGVDVQSGLVNHYKGNELTYNVRRGLERIGAGNLHAIEAGAA